MRRVRVGFALAVVGVSLFATGGMSGAQPTPASPYSDHDGPISSCAEIGASDATRVLVWPGTTADVVTENGVTLALAANGKSVSWNAPGKIVQRVVVKAQYDNGGYTYRVYSPQIPQSGLEAPPKPNGSTPKVLLAFLCYRTAAPDPVVPEAPFVVLLTASAATVVGGYALVRRRSAAQTPR